jgi:hypothetical protein
VDVEEDGVDFCFGAGACGCGCYVAFFVSDDVGVEKTTANGHEEQEGCTNRNLAEVLTLRFFAHLR